MYYVSVYTNLFYQVSLYITLFICIMILSTSLSIYHVYMYISLFPSIIFPSESPYMYIFGLFMLYLLSYCLDLFIYLLLATRKTQEKKRNFNIYLFGIYECMYKLYVCIALYVYGIVL